MLNGGGNANGKKINRSRLVVYWQKTAFAREAHFFAHFFPVVVAS